MPIDPELFEKGVTDARAGIRRTARVLDGAPPDYAAGYLAATPLDGVAAVDVRTDKPDRLVERLYAVAVRLEVPAPVPFVTRATVALLGPAAEARARRRARALFDTELRQDERDGAGPEQATAA
ncbi:hypothetical protein [Cognatilysobacter bugurensis]|uniref:Uncharacterized protein n=1 Tax=Cognatilysobacter bugurensis TaxID=543356 RepID=A0A918T147_9GAMM|nr:hypothetical protein [Lysobacter bugurensis]GHA84112.1 hypothetical protein GCM10007067_22900 [Lysobacter bugurensis]